MAPLRARSHRTKMRFHDSLNDHDERTDHGGGCHDHDNDTSCHDNDNDNDTSCHDNDNDNDTSCHDNDNDPVCQRWMRPVGLLSAFRA
jgi:hypothetical protein